MERRRFRAAVPLAAWMGLAAALPARADSPLVAPPPRVYQEEFHLRRGGGFAVPRWLDLDGGQAGAIVESGCRALGFDCSEAGDVGRFLKRPIRFDGYLGTARVLRVRAGHYYAAFVAPDGFTTCKAGIFLKDGTIADGATFSGAIQRSGTDRLSVYADLGDAASAAIEFRLLVLYVAKADVPPARCWPDQTIIFLCRGLEDCRGSASYPETDLR